MSTAEAPAEAVPDRGVPAVQLTGITKRFPGVVANSDVNLTVARGEVHAICGENGAGKSTLMKILYGMQPPDEGTIAINGEEIKLRNPQDAIRAGIGMVHQHFMLADNLTVAENIILGAEPSRGGLINRRAARRRTPNRTRCWRSWASPTASASRSSRCSTAARRSSSWTSRPRSSCHRRSTHSSPRSAKCRPTATRSSSSRTSSTRCARSPTRSP